MHDGGKRLTFTVDAWRARIAEGAKGHQQSGTLDFEKGVTFRERKDVEALFRRPEIKKYVRAYTAGKDVPAPSVKRVKKR